MRPSADQRPLRESIVILLEKKHLLTGPKILDMLAAAKVEVNKTSVYRALDNLVADGEVIRQSFGTNEIWYERLEPAYHHDHLVCTDCGDVESLPCAVSLKGIPKSFEVQYHNLTVYGLCKDCQRSSGRSKKP